MTGMAFRPLVAVGVARISTACLVTVGRTPLHEAASRTTMPRDADEHGPSEGEVGGWAVEWYTGRTQRESAPAGSGGTFHGGDDRVRLKATNRWDVRDFH